MAAGPSRHEEADRLLRRLRQQDLPIIARTERDRVLLDPRTVLPEEDAVLVTGLRAALSEIK